MSYKIISDTSCDCTQQLEKEWNLSLVPFKIRIEDEDFIDDDNLNLEDFINKMMKSKHPVKTSCPSPFDYMSELEKAEEDNIFIVTISSSLSGSYNAACVARDEFIKNNPKKNVYVVNSKSASAGQTSVVRYINELIKEDSSFEEKVKSINNFVDKNNTYFILESLENLIKNGRIKKSAGLIANVLKIRPIMRGVNGEIELYEMNRGFRKSLSKLADALGSICDSIEERTLIISHVNSLDKAKFFEKKVKELYKFKDIIIVHTKGLASAYADNGGIVIGF